MKAIYLFPIWFLILISVLFFFFEYRKRKWIFPIWFFLFLGVGLWSIYVFIYAVLLLLNPLRAADSELLLNFISFASFFLPSIILLAILLIDMPRGEATQLNIVLITVIGYLILAIITYFGVTKIFTIKILDESKNPVPDVLVTYMMNITDKGLIDSHVTRKKISDNNGIIKIPFLPVGSISFVNIQKVGYGNSGEEFPYVYQYSLKDVNFFRNLSENYYNLLGSYGELKIFILQHLLPKQ